MLLFLLVILLKTLLSTQSAQLRDRFTLSEVQLKGSEKHNISWLNLSVHKPHLLLLQSELALAAGRDTLA
jgi:hypothetical protein